MTPERWQQIDNLLQTVVERPLAEREALLDEACSGDRTLRQEVKSLISFREKAESFLEMPALEEAADLFCDNQAESMVGQLVGSYNIEALLGFGGMGEVYLAEDTKLDRKVAIKFLPTYLEENELAKKRLIREAKAVAKLDHHNICAVYEVKEEGNRSFIVMQYVTGGTLGDRIKNQKLELCEALDICLQVVEALVEAHSRGIIHRDIKPGNIMITARGQVKVLDFGLAKVVGSTALEQSDAKHQSLLSRPGERPGTPPYMSPEQAQGVTVDARSDLFAVGVILYECITGRRPFSGKTDREILAQVIHFNPPPPSQFNPNLPPELNGIVLKALAKEPDARYQSAGDLLGDLRALRVGLQAQNEANTRPLPLKLDSSTASTLTNLFNVLRQPSVIMSATGVVLCLALFPYFIITIVIPRLRAYRPPPAAAHWYEIGTTALRNGAYFEASKALRQAVAADEKFALAHARLAEAYTELDYNDKAKDEIIRAESLANELRIQQPDALYLKAVTNTVLRDFPPAVESYQQIARQAPDNEKANVYLDLGRAYEKNDRSEKAKENYQEATRLAPQEAAAFLRLGVVCGQLQDFPCASDAFQKAQSLYQALSNQEGVTEVFYQRGFLLLDQVKLAEARVQLENALQMTKATGNLYQQIRVLQALSSAAALEGHIVEAKQQAAEAIQLARDNDIENQVTSGLIWLGNAFLLKGDYGDAEKYYQQALELAQRDKMRLNEAWARRQLGSLRSAQHKTEEALGYIEQALAFYEQGPYHHWISLSLISLGRIHRDKGDYEAALKTFKELLQVGDQLGDQLQVGLAHLDIGNVLSYQEQYSEALRHFDESYKIFTSLKAEVYLAYAAQSRASVLWQLGRSEEAKTALDEATSVAERAEHPEDTYKQLLADIHLTDSRLELSNWHLQGARVKSEKALALAAKQYPDISIQAKNTLALAQARGGAVLSPKLLCEDAVNMATSLGDPQLLTGTLLSCAEEMLDGGETQRALETVLRAQESFARFGKEDSEWRAWLIAGQASRRLGKEADAHEYASYAVNRLSELEQKWGSEAYSGYLTRSDITHFRNQLEQLLKP
jgi:serine/threonine protein kinase/Tfp pilus assembly protein PilF